MLADKETDAGIASDWAKIQEKYTAEPESPPDDLKLDAPEEETIPVSREADGKFKASEKDKTPDKGKDLKAPAAAKETRSEPSKEGSADATAASEGQQRDITRAPSTWKPAARAEFDKLPPSIKAEIHRRESDFSAGQAQLIPDATLGKEMRTVIDPYRAMIEAEGGTPARAIADFFRIAAVLRTGSMAQKYQAIAQTAQQFGVDLRRFGQPQQQNQQQPQGQQQDFRDPRLDKLLADLQQREQNERESVVTRWMNEVDAQGNPKREYLNDVINEVSALIPALRQQDPAMTHTAALDAAYERAIWAHPEIRTLLAQKQQTELDATRRADNQTRVRDAKRAGSVNVPRRASVPSAGKPGTMEQTLQATARELGLIT